MPEHYNPIEPSPEFELNNFDSYHAELLPGVLFFASQPNEKLGSGGVEEGDEDEWLTLVEAHEEYNFSVGQLRRLAKDGKVEAEKRRVEVEVEVTIIQRVQRQKMWVLSRKSLEAYIQTPRPGAGPKSLPPAESDS